MQGRAVGGVGSRRRKNSPGWKIDGTSNCCRIDSMTRTQIQLPDDLHRRAKRFAAEREISLAEITRRGIELFLGRFPASRPEPKGWQLPRIDGGGLRVPLDQLRRIASEDEAGRSLRRR